MAKAWSAWLPDVLQVAHGCPSILASQEIAATARQFFAESRAWKAMLEPVTLDIGEPDMQIMPDDSQQTTVVRLESAALGRADLRVLNTTDLRYEYGPDWATMTGKPEVATLLTPITVRFVPYPVAAVDELLSLEVSLRPADSATGVPDEMFYAYRNAIAWGAQSRLLMLPDRPWTNADIGIAKQAMFDDAVVSAKSSAARSFSRARITGKARWC